MTQASTPNGAAAKDRPLSRRVAQRRAELGLSLEEVGRRAGIDPGYLEYLEHNAGTRLSAGSLILLAMALETSPDLLLGTRRSLRRERGGVGRHPEVEPLTRDQCIVHLDAGTYGRVVYFIARGPVAIPVNFEFTQGEIVISTDHRKAQILARAGVVGFEVDQVEEDLGEGWSVLVTGPARRVTARQERMALSSLGLESWSGGGPHDLVAITPRQVTGRVIVHPVAWEG